MITRAQKYEAAKSLADQWRAMIGRLKQKNPPSATRWAAQAAGVLDKELTRVEQELAVLEAIESDYA